MGQRLKNRAGEALLPVKSQLFAQSVQVDHHRPAVFPLTFGGTNPRSVRVPMPCMRAASARPEVARVGQRKNGQCTVLDRSELGMNSLYVELVVESFPLTQRHPSVP